MLISKKFLKRRTNAERYVGIAEAIHPFFANVILPLHRLSPIKKGPNEDLFLLLEN